MKAEYRIVLEIIEGKQAPSATAIQGALEVGWEGAPDEMGFDAVHHCVSVEQISGAGDNAAFVVVERKPHARQDDIDYFREQGWTWEYPGFLMAPDTPGFNFTVGLDEDFVFTIQVTTEEGDNLDEFNVDVRSHEAVLERLREFKAAKGLA
jgi:hypothetical protein